MTEPEELRLGDLLRELPTDSTLSGDGTVSVRGVHQDSRRVARGDLFVARKGAHADGARFIEAAIANGAAALLVDRESAVPVSLPCIRVSDTRIGLALAAAAVYGHPAFSLDVIGITGTNGKTTTAHLVRAAIDGALDRPSCGIVGTVGHSFASFEEVASHTTPEADDLARVLRSMRDLGATHVAMEVSSIALTSRRVHAIRFRVAAFTNLSQDHLDYHGTMESYAAAKGELFTSYAPGSSVINVDDSFGRELATRVRSPLVRVSAKVEAPADEADVAPISLSLSSRGIQAIVRVPGGKVELESPLFGAHNLENLLVALGIVVALDLDVTRATRALRHEVGAPGRLERCETRDDDVVVLVDYAHTPDALVRVLGAVRALTRGRVLAVFGCGGDRDRSKRSLMGEAAAAGADVVIVTNDNPRGEAALEIARPIVAGLVSRGSMELAPADLASASRGHIVLLDRAVAIDLAVRSAAPGDTVILCGKGHETYQLIGDQSFPFDDRIEARRALERRRDSASRPSPGGP